MKSILFYARVAVWFLSGFALASAAPVTRDLGRNLAYFRVHELPRDLPQTESARPQPCVLDVRYVRADAAAGATLLAWLKFHASARTPVLVLANAETDAALLAPLGPGHTAANILVIGATARGFTPDIAVQTSPQNERHAYDALEAGAEVTAVISENGDKARNDEASLSHDRSTEPSETAKERTAGPPLDAALQRAVHLHRALLALKKI